MAKPTTAEAVAFAAEVAREVLMSNVLVNSMGHPANIVDAANNIANGLFAVAKAMEHIAEAIEKKE